MLDYSQSEKEAEKFIVSARKVTRNGKKELLVKYADGTAKCGSYTFEERCHVSAHLMSQASDHFKSIELMGELCKTLRVNIGLLFTLAGTGVAFSTLSAVATGSQGLTAVGLCTTVGCLIGTYKQEKKRKLYSEKIEELEKYKWFLSVGCAYLNADNIFKLDKETKESLFSGIDEKDIVELNKYYNSDDNAVHIDAMVVDRVSLESLEQLLCNMRLMLTYKDHKDDLLNMERAKVMQFHMKV